MQAKLLAVTTDLQHHEKHKTEWIKRAITPIQVSSMQEAIEELLKGDFLIVGINADCVNYLPLLKIMRDTTPSPIHIMTSNYSYEDECEAIKNGADHYGKWLENAEESTYRGVLMIQRFLERQAQSKKPPKFLFYSQILINPVNRQVYINDSVLDLTRKEYDLLNFLMSDPDRVYTNAQIIKRVWGDEYIENDNTILWNVVKRLRKKLKDLCPDNDYIQSIHDIGYAFDQ